MKDTDQQQLPALLIQSSRINSWLLSRKIIQTDYPKKLKDIDCKVNDYFNKYPEVNVPIFESPSLFLGCREFLEALAKTDNKTDFFGRSSPLVRAWTEVLSLFQKNNLYLAEVGDSINELAAVQVPRCKMFISDRHKNLLDLRQRLKEQSLNLIRKEELLEKVYKEFHVDVKEENIRLRLLEEAGKVPMLLTEFVHSLTSLKTALQLYVSFKNFVLGGFQDDYHEPEKFYGCCPTLKLLIDSGHVMVFTWKNGCEPEHIERSDDFVPFLLQQEKMKVNQLSMELCQNVFTDSNVPSELNEILWDENEVGAIDFGPFDVESVENIEFERENMVSTSSSGTPDNPNVDSASQSNVPSSINERKPIVASGASARYLLDSVDGRQALLNDLLELNAFLQRFQEDLLERLDNESEHQLSRTGCNAFKPSGGIGCDTIQNIIIQNAPNDLSYTSNDISRMIELVKEALNKLTTSSLSQLMMIRTRIGYLDRLTDRLLDYRRQVELARTRCSQTQKLIDKALMEQQEKTTQLAQLKNYCKKLVSFLEDELSRICNRQVQITGQFCDL
ncbi:Unconventional myosin-X, variant 2 [Schistosoma haematobium]|uniref:Unconventional myosin-X, variant 2 n=2 Tax=Schistosoma haematobium TaxID=6185 RepID=A0A922LJZ4_SCHHA|nr:Unconventional myosin-X, variant 2 [Schistosoma haematobium]KAH9587671.1 Unconventional myosin-X, variant 2 [Schistosoma haematobium]